jgi:hypothetical protein
MRSGVRSAHRRASRFTVLLESEVGECGPYPEPRHDGDSPGDVESRGELLVVGGHAVDETDATGFGAVDLAAREEEFLCLVDTHQPTESCGGAPSPP